MDELLAELQRIVEAVTILSKDSYRFAGREFRATEPGSAPRKPENRSANPTLASLHRLIYRQCYVCRFSGRVADHTWQIDGRSDFGEELAAAAGSEPSWDAGWEIQEIEPSGAILARKNGVARRFLPGSFITHTGPGVFPKPDTHATIYTPAGSNTTQPDYFLAFGQTVSPEDENYNIVRFYWNIAADGAACLLQELSRRLNRFQVPFVLKCVNDRRLFFRRDAAVLYINKRYYPVAAMLIEDVHEHVRPHLEADTPLFTRPLAPGLAFAEDPGESFGMNRTRIVAEALWRSYQKGHSTAERRLKEVVARFRAQRVSLERPWLNPSPGGETVDPYQFPFVAR